MSGHSDWGQIYQQNIPNQPDIPPPGSTRSDNMFAEPPAISTTTATISAAHLGATGHLSPDGRVSKPVRKRSRASRRTPTTLLNTDTSNFRAMVQQFTGGPSASFTMESYLSNNSRVANNPSRFSFGFDQGQIAQASPSGNNNDSNINIPQLLVPNLQYQQYNVVQPQQGMTRLPPHPPPQHHQFMFSLRNPTNSNNMNAPGNPRPEVGGFGVVEGEGGGSQLASRAHHGGFSSPSENRKSNNGGFLL